MKSLRKSLNGYKDHPQSISTPLPSLSKPPSAILPPQKVIKALQTYKSNAPQELSFEKGDFFHVLNDVNNQGLWYEAHNPATGARGLVPCHMFEEFQKGTPKPRTPTMTGSPTNGTPNGWATADRPLSAASPKHQAFYAVVLHDFVAERADELDAKAGDSITIVAQSNREWFVAKPIGRLGRPGLIPVSFVEVRDPATGRPVEDVMEIIDGGALPRVEEWKRAMLTYKANSISLGVLEESSAANIAKSPPERNGSPVNTKGLSFPVQQQQKSIPPPPVETRPASPKSLPEGILLSADIKSFHFEMDEYWFRVHAIFQPYDPSDSHSLPPAKQLVLFRSYNDFYDFQVELLSAFPQEAGRPNPESRILPYMPGPVEHVDTEITNSRRVELDDYLHRLCELRLYARYIVEHQLVREFVALKPGDAEVEVEPRIREIEAMNQPASEVSQAYEESEQDPDYAAERMSRLQVAEGTNGHASDGSDYGDGDGTGPAYERDKYDYRYGEEGRSHVSTNQAYKTTEPLRPRSRTTTGHDRAENGASIYGRSSPASASALQFDQYRSSDQSRSSIASSQGTSSPVSTRVSQAGSTATSRTSTSGRSRSQSNATYNPPISATNPQIAFMKIKVYDKASQDIIALRVHPKITYSQLLEKASERTRRTITQLRYQQNEVYVELQGNEHFRSWLDNNEKYMLYAP